MTAVDLRLLANIIGGLLDMAIESVQVKYAPDKFEQAKILFVKLNNKMFSKNDQYANEFLDFYLQNVERIAELQSAVKK